MAGADETETSGPIQGVTYNVGLGITPAAWGNIVAQAFRLGSERGPDAFFGDAAKLRVISAAGIMCGISMNGWTTPKEIYDYIFSGEEAQSKNLANAESLLSDLDASLDPSDRDKADWIRDAISYERGPWADIKKADKTMAGVTGQITNVFDRLASSAMDRAFGSVANGVNLQDMLTGRVIILDVNTKKYGKFAASLIALCMFAQLDTFMDNRLEYPATDIRRRRPTTSMRIASLRNTTSFFARRASRTSR